MGGIRNGLDGGVGQQGDTIITKSGESGGVVGVPTAPANVQIVNQGTEGPEGMLLEAPEEHVWNMEPGYTSIKL